MSQTKTTPKEPMTEELLAQIQQLKDESQKKDDLLKEKEAEIDGLTEYVSELEAEQKAQIVIATASNGAKYELHFVSILMQKEGISRRIKPEDVKADPTLLDALIESKSLRIRPYKPDNQEKGGKV